MAQLNFFLANRGEGLNSFCGTVSGAPWTPENARGLGLNDQTPGGVVMNPTVDGSEMPFPTT